MQKKDFILAMLVVIVWGVNFTVISLGLDGVPPMMLVAVRYIFVVFPAIFFIEKPKTTWKYIALYGLSVGVGQFACLFYAMHIGMPAGLASIVLQLQAFITAVLGIFALKEGIQPKQVVGFAIAAIGLIAIGIASTSGDTYIPINALLLMLLAPTFWALSNIVSKSASNKARAEGHELQMLNMVIWSGLFPPIPMLILAVFIDTPAAMIHAFSTLSFMSIFSTFYLAYVSTLFGYGVWNSLLSKYPVSKIAPLSLLVPITGLITARVVLGEQLTGLQMLGACCIFVGLAVTSLDFKRRKFEKHKIKFTI